MNFYYVNNGGNLLEKALDGFSAIVCPSLTLQFPIRAGGRFHWMHIFDVVTYTRGVFVCDTATSKSNLKLEQLGILLDFFYIYGSTAWFLFLREIPVQGVIFACQLAKFWLLGRRSLC